MTKRRASSGFGGGGMPGGMGGMMGKIQKMQEDMQQTQAQLENETLEVSVGGGAVRVVITGHQRVRSILINPEVVDLNDEEWMQDLQDLVTLAVNQSIEESQALAAERLEKITGGLGGLPGLGGMFG